MTLLVVILVFISQYYAKLGAHFARTPWVRLYLTRMQSIFQKTFLWGNWGGIIILLLPLIILVGLVQVLLHGWLLSIFRFFFDFIVLWFCVDAYQLKEKLNPYLTSLSKEDFTDTKTHSEKFLKQPHEFDAPDKLQQIARKMTSAIFLNANEKLFGILFWFILFGPVGAVIYFLIAQIKEMAMEVNSTFVELLLPANTAFGIVNWIPVRVLGLSYALVGHFVSGFHYCRKYFSCGIQQTSEFAIQSGFAALNMEDYDVIHADIEENEAALALVDRALFLWVVLIALFTLSGWL